jgi:uncharacterized protein YdcH (DUF465 family)
MSSHHSGFNNHTTVNNKHNMQQQQHSMQQHNTVQQHNIPVNVSNIQRLPNEITEFTRLNEEKNKLRQRITEINQRCRSLSECIIQNMTQSEMDTYEILPNRDEEFVFGKLGALQLKMHNEYEAMTKDNLTLYLIQFFRYILPEETEEKTMQLGVGVGNWIWANRARKSKVSLERVYLDSSTGKRVRRSHNNEGKSEKQQQPKPKKTKVAKAAKIHVEPKSIPKTCQDFLSIPSFQKLLSEHMHE